MYVSVSDCEAETLRAKENEVRRLRVAVAQFRKGVHGGNAVEPSRAGSTGVVSPGGARGSGLAGHPETMRAKEFSWLITPRAASTSAGCWVELGHAIALRKHIVVSGDHLRSIFTALVQEGER